MIWPFDWRADAKSFARTIVAWAGPGTPKTRDAIARKPGSQTIRHLLAATNQHRVAVIGTSFGGALAAALAVMAPCAVAGAVLNDIGPDTSPDGLEKVLAHIGTAHRMSDWAAAVNYLKQTFPNLPATNEERWLRVAHNTFREDAGKLVNNWDIGISRTLTDLAEPFLAARVEASVENVQALRTGAPDSDFRN